MNSPRRFNSHKEVRYDNLDFFRDVPPEFYLPLWKNLNAPGLKTKKWLAKHGPPRLTPRGKALYMERKVGADFSWSVVGMLANTAMYIAASTLQADQKPQPAPYKPFTEEFMDQYRVPPGFNPNWWWHICKAWHNPDGSINERGLDYLPLGYFLDYHTDNPHRFLSEAFLPILGAVGHGLVEGGSRVGKTSLFLNPLAMLYHLRNQRLSSLARRYRRAGRIKDAERVEAKRYAIVFMDPKPEVANMMNMQEGARISGTQFRLFTSEVGHASNAFNPFYEIHTANLTKHQKAQALATGLELFSNLSEGEKYYSSRYYAPLVRAYERGDFLSSRAFYEKMPSEFFNNSRNADTDRDSWHPAEQVRLLATQDLSNVTPNDPGFETIWKERIDWQRVLKDCESVYYAIDTMTEELAGPVTMRLGLQTLSLACRDFQIKNNGRKPNVIVFLEEFPQVASPRFFANSLSKAAGRGLSYALSLQSLDSLAADYPGMTAAMLQSTWWKARFDAGPAEREALQQLSGLHIEEVKKFSLTSSDEGISETVMFDPVEKPRMSPDFISEVVRHPEKVFFQVSVDKDSVGVEGRAGAIHLHGHHIDKKKYNSHDKVSNWPAQTEGTLVQGSNSIARTLGGQTLKSKRPEKFSQESERSKDKKENENKYKADAEKKQLQPHEEPLPVVHKTPQFGPWQRRLDHIAAEYPFLNG